MTNDLTAIPEAEFDRVWKLVCEIAVAERHFNGLQQTYRTLASTWMLASAAGIGFVLEKLSSEHSALLIAGISAAGGAGVVLLWILDLLVYHRLLDACFVEGLRLEQEFSWIPPIRGNMMAVHSNRGILPKVVLFYAVTSSILFLTAASSLCGYWVRSQSTPMLYATVLTAAAFSVTEVGMVRTSIRSDEALKKRLRLVGG